MQSPRSAASATAGIALLGAECTSHTVGLEGAGLTNGQAGHSLPHTDSQGPFQSHTF